MKTLSLIGKKYIDTILKVNNIKPGETNSCFSATETLGGVRNFLEAELEDWRIDFLETGTKRAYIVSDRKLSQRTSYVMDLLPASISADTVKNINNKSDWLHVCYIDDMECYEEIENVNIKYSLDFCTDTPRGPFSDAINNAEVVFDSMERKHLYESNGFFTPIILHNERGIEVLINNEVVFSESMQPLNDLDVNGAGDIFAAKFIEKYNKFSLNASAKTAMLETTEILRKRKKRNEQKI